MLSFQPSLRSLREYYKQIVQETQQNNLKKANHLRGYPRGANAYPEHVCVFQICVPWQSSWHGHSPK